MVIYVIGKISDVNPDAEEKNRLLAAEVGAQLWRMGHAVIVPHLNDYHSFLGYGKDLTWDDFMRGDKELLVRSDAAVVLPNWTSSKGSQIEIETAKEYNIPLYYWPDFPEVTDSVYRDTCLLVLISGKQGSGKTTLSDAITRYLNGRNIANRQFKFADTIYELHHMIWERMSKRLHLTPPQKDGRLLQLLGTEWGRKTIHENIWVCITRDDVLKFFRKTAPMRAVAIIDDVRFPNELAINYPHKLTIRLNAPSETRKVRCGASWRDDENHESETALDQLDRDRKFDMIFNSRNLDAGTIASKVCREIAERLKMEAE